MAGRTGTGQDSVEMCDSEVIIHFTPVIGGRLCKAKLVV